MTDASGTATYSYDSMDRLTEKATPEVIDQKCKIYDTGALPERDNFPWPTSPYYAMELQQIGLREYPTIPIVGADSWPTNPQYD